MRPVWADTILYAERQHLLRLILWGGSSIIAATAVVTTMSLRRIRSPLLTHFAAQTAAWGTIVGIIAGIELNAATMRDLSGAARLERLLWMNVGLDAGYVAIGVVLAAFSWVAAKKLSGVGAGAGIVVQGLALLVIDLQFASVISR